MLLRILDWTAIILLIISGLNSGIIGLFNYDLLIDLFSANLIVAHSVLFVIGLAAIYAIIRIARIVRRFQPAP